MLATGEKQVIWLGGQNTMRYLIATLLLVVLLVSAYFPLRTLFEPWQRARVASKYPMHALQADL